MHDHNLTGLKNQRDFSERLFDVYLSSKSERTSLCECAIDFCSLFCESMNEKQFTSSAVPCSYMDNSTCTVEGVGLIKML